MMKKLTVLTVALTLALPLFVGCANQPATPVAPKSTAITTVAGDLPDASDAARLLPLQGTVNARTFASLKGQQGVIPASAFVRTADTGQLTAADRDLLAKDGVVLDIDLRTADEESHSHDVLADDARFAYKRISLMGVEKIDMSHLPATLGEMYAQSLDANQPQFGQVFKAFAAQRDGIVLFHCTAGKDRTGMVAALLLDLAGVKRKDIAHNYAISGHYYAPMAEASMKRAGYAEMLKANPNIAALMGAPPEAIEAFLDKLHKQYGGARAYLHTVGLSDAEVDSLLVRLGQKG